MSKKPKPGGIVRIKHRPYIVVKGPFLDGDYYIEVRSADAPETYMARADWWRCGRGPWRIVNHETTAP